MRRFIVLILFSFSIAQGFEGPEFMLIGRDCFKEMAIKTLFLPATIEAYSNLNLSMPSFIISGN
jgi:hypothetical protein